MGDTNRIIVDVPDIDYGTFVPKELLPATWLVIHQLFSVLRLKGKGRLSSEILRDLLGVRSTNIMKTLRNVKLLQIVKGHSAGLKSREYKFVPGFKTFCFKTITDPKLVRLYVRNRTYRKQSIHRWLDDILGDDKLSFDKDKATGEVEKLTELDFKLLGKESSFEDYKTILRHSIHRATHLQIHYANQRLGLSTVDGFGFRYHHPFTSLPKSFRGFIRWEGQTLVNVDIRNSQPLFLCLAYMDTHGHWTSDWTQYRSLCEAGQIYESLNQQMIPREEFKEKFFGEVLFARIDSIQWSKFAQEFIVTFPTVFNYILSLKTPTRSRQLTGDDKLKPHRLAAKALQRAESQFMFKSVIPKLKEMGVKPVIPIHDSILTTPGNGSIVQSVIEEEFAKVGFKCGVRIEPT